MQERCLEYALQPHWLTSTVIDNLHKVLNGIVIGLYFLFLEKHGLKFLKYRKYHLAHYHLIQQIRQHY